VAHGEVATIEPSDLPKGWALTTSGRVSGVTEPGALSVHYPFPIKDLVALDDALTYSSRASKARFAVYLGDLGSDTAARAREILAKVPTPDNAVLIAVSPDQCAIEVVYGSQVRGRGAESAAPLGVAAASSAFEQGELIDGLVSAVRVLSAGISPA
jgi:Ni,Fe-hydrogenase III small subunit